MLGTLHRDSVHAVLLAVLAPALGEGECSWECWGTAQPTSRDQRKERWGADAWAGKKRQVIQKMACNESE